MQYQIATNSKVEMLRRFIHASPKDGGDLKRHLNKHGLGNSKHHLNKHSSIPTVASSCGSYDSDRSTSGDDNYEDLQEECCQEQERRHELQSLPLSQSQLQRSDNLHNDLSSLSLSSPSPCFIRQANILDEYVVFPKILGEGCYGIVRECLHRATCLPFAVKTISKSKVANLAMVRSEVRLLSTLSHDGVLRLVDCYEDQDFVHIVTEKCQGGELFDHIADRTSDDGCYDEGEAATIIHMLLDAVAYLHDNDVVHRDIKPENILFETTPQSSSSTNITQLKLIDFGLSRMHRCHCDDPLTRLVGTSYYMSPELLSGSYDRCADVWAVGIIAYILLCGYPPFNGESDDDVFASVEDGHLVFPDRHWGDKTECARDFVRCLLRRDANLRHTAREALDHPWIKINSSRSSADKREMGGSEEKKKNGSSSQRRKGKRKSRPLRYLRIP